MEGKIINMDINWYKNIIKSQRIRSLILKLFSFVPNKLMLKFQYRIKLNRKLNIKNPTRFTEKIQLYKLAYKNPHLHNLVDKYQVRKYLTDKGLEKNLVKLYGVYDEFNEIEFDNLPKEFVMKSTNGGGGEQVLFINKTIMDINDIKNKTKNWFKKSNSRLGGREFAYHGIKGRILIEENLGIGGKKVNDYKFLCFNGEPKYVILDMDRFSNHKRNIYSLEWKHLKIKTDKNYNDIHIPKPKNYNEMIEIVKKIAEPFPFVRVDMYNIDGSVYFGELTFYPWSGYVRFDPDEFDYSLGKYFISI